MHWPRALLIGAILSLLAGVNINASAADQLDLAAFRTAALKQHNVYRAKRRRQLQPSWQHLRSISAACAETQIGRIVLYRA